MKINLQTYRGIGWYLTPQAIFWVAAGSLLLSCGTTGSFLLLNGAYVKAIDHPMLWLTEVSGAYILVSVFVIIYARSRPVDAIMGSVLSFVAWYTCITIKYNFFANWKNPSVLLKGHGVHLLGGQMQPELNFPSAHAVVVTALFTFIAFMYSHSRIHILLISVFGVALTYTRIYAGWGYLSDVLSGSILGTAIALICIPYLETRIGKWYDRRSDYWKDMIRAIIRAAAICTIFVNLKDFIL